MRNQRDARRAEDLSRHLTADLDRAAVDPERRLPFVAVPLARFVLMSLATFSLYEIWWFYANWKRVQERTGEKMYPFWRAVFAPIFCYFFVDTVRRTSQKASVPVALSAGGIALAYAALIASQELPDPWWWLCYLSFVPLLPVVRHVAQLHHALYPGLESYAPFGKGHVVALVVFAPLTLLVASTVAVPTKALYGSELRRGQREQLAELGHVEPDERVLFFYSAGLFSVEEDGNLLTDRRVVSWEELDGERWYADARHADVADVEVEWSESLLEDTVITVHTVDGDSFGLLVSSEEGRDREFVNVLESLRGRAAGTEPTAHP